MEYKITELGNDWLVIRPYAYKEKEKVTILVTEAYADGTTKIVDERIEWRDAPIELGNYLYVFERRRYEIMLSNFKLGNCPITNKGLIRYSSANGWGDSWYGCPARTAQKMARQGVPIPKELFGLYSKILGDC